MSEFDEEKDSTDSKKSKVEKDKDAALKDMDVPSEEEVVETGESEEVPISAKSKKLKGGTKASARNKAGVELSFGSEEVLDEDAAKISAGEDTKARVFGQQARKEYFVANSGDKYVVWLAHNIKCKIGKQFFKFEKDKKYRVDANIKNILLKRGVLRAI